jgi:hypothetical protein
LIRNIGGAGENSHVIMATHDPLVICGLGREQVQLFQRDPDTGHVSAARPAEDPKYMGVAALLRSEIYGLRSLLPPETLDKINRRRLLAARESLTETESNDLQGLDDELRAADLLQEQRDPTFREFAEAYAELQKERGLDKAVVSLDERKALRELAISVLRDVVK